jgi:integrase
MATIKKNGSGWRAQIAIQGTRESKTFSTKAEATSWAAERETEIRKQATTGVDVRKTCGDAFNRYGREVSIHKKKTRWEQTRLAFIGNQTVGGTPGTPLKDVLLNSLTSDMLGQWRDKRLNVDKVAGSTVNRDFSLLSNVFTVARKEWKWMRASPSTDVRRPKDPPPRDRRILEDEIDMITLASGFCETKVRKVGQRVGVAFLFAIESAMRAGEICGLRPPDINGSVATLEDTKNGTRRHVPLSPRALELLGFLPKVPDDETMFGINEASLDANFRKIRATTAIKELTFHDTRHEAITRLAKKLNVLELARAVGHRDLNMLQIYYNETAENLAKKL